MIKILVITHGLLGAELIKTAESIVGKQDDIQSINLGQAESLSMISTTVNDTLALLENSDGTLIMTDMLGGTPCNASLPFSPTHTIEIITGVNLYMLISALLSRKNMALKDLAKKAIEDGIKSIADAKEIFLNKLK
jgi:PTS system mannose-specific IIA component